MLILQVQNWFGHIPGCKDFDIFTEQAKNNLVVYPQSSIFRVVQLSVYEYIYWWYISLCMINDTEITIVVHVLSNFIDLSSMHT